LPRKTTCFCDSLFLISPRLSSDPRSCYSPVPSKFLLSLSRYCSEGGRNGRMDGRTEGRGDGGGEGGTEGRREGRKDRRREGGMWITKSKQGPRRARPRAAPLPHPHSALIDAHCVCVSSWCRWVKWGTRRFPTTTTPTEGRSILLFFFFPRIQVTGALVCLAQQQQQLLPSRLPLPAHLRGALAPAPAP
jgi:hypothetical protein